LGDKAPKGLTLTTHLHLVLTSGMSGAILLGVVFGETPCLGIYLEFA
jgi:hypothetical protein